MKSFSSEIREELFEAEDKMKLCCAFSFLYGYIGFSYTKNDENIECFTNAENQMIIKKLLDFISTKKKVVYTFKGRKVLMKSSFLRYFTFAEIEKNIFKCTHCKASFLRGLFLSHAYINDPAKSYRLDLVFNTENHAKEAISFLESMSLEFKYTLRKDKYVLYTKDSESISDILAIIGAQNSAFKVMNTKIMKELLNDVNRASNCDSGNINKTVKANQKYTEAINYLIEAGEINKLPDSLKEMALKKIEYDNITFTDLGKKFNPEISKSGVYHRLERIYEYYIDKKDN